MAPLGRAGAAAVKILETGAVLVGRLCENSVKKKALAMFTVREWSCRALSLFFHPSVTPSLSTSPPSCVGSVACVCVCMCGEQVCHVFLVGGEWDEAH